MVSEKYIPRLFYERVLTGANASGEGSKKGLL